MSKYVSTRLERIKNIIEELALINSNIENYITILEEIKKEHNMFNIRICFQVISDIDENTTIQCFNNLFYITFIENNVHYSYDIYLKQRRDLLPHNFQYFLKIIDTTINLDDLNNYIMSSNRLYYQITSIYHEIKLKYGKFAINSNKLISYFKKSIKEQTIENDNKYYYGYFKMRKDNKTETIHLIYQSITYDYEYLYQVKFPLKEDIQSIYNQRNLSNIYDKELYIEIFKNEFILLNKYFYENFIIDKNSIDFDFYFQLINFDIDYTKTHTYHLGVEALNNDKILMIIDKINLEKQLNNF